MPPPAQCTIQASKMIARMIRASHAKNSTIPGMAYPLMVLVLATTASYPPVPDLIDRLTGACGPKAQLPARCRAGHRPHRTLALGAVRESCIVGVSTPFRLRFPRGSRRQLVPSAYSGSEELSSTTQLARPLT